MWYYNSFFCSIVNINSRIISENNFQKYKMSAKSSTVMVCVYVGGGCGGNTQITWKYPSISFIMTFRRCLLDVMEMSWYLRCPSCPPMSCNLVYCPPMYSIVLQFGLFFLKFIQMLSIFFSPPQKNIYQRKVSLRRLAFSLRRLASGICIMIKNVVKMSFALILYFRTIITLKQ